MKRKIALICMLLVSMLCFSVFAVSCKKPQTPSYTINYSVENSACGSAVGTVSSGTKVKKGNSVTLTANANTGYSFDGWYEDEQLVSNQSTYTFTVSQNVDLVAKFSAMQFALNYSCQVEQGEISGSVQSNTQVTFGSSITLTAQAKEGYSFSGWYVIGEEAPVCTTATYEFNMPANAYSVEARFTINSYVLNVSWNDEHCEVNVVGPNGQVYQSGDSVPYNTALNLTVTEKVGYDVVQILEGQTQVSTSKVYSFNMPAREVSLSVETKAEIRKVQFISQSVIIKTQEVEYNACATAYQPSRENHEFIGWYTDASLTKLYDFNTKVVSDVSLYAGWEETIKTYSVEFVDWNGKRIDTIQTVQEGESAIIPATPSREGYNFDKWVCEDGDYTNVDKNLVVKATYVIKEYEVTFYKDSSKVQEHAVQTIKHGELAKIPQTIIDIEEDLMFDKWTYEDGTEFIFQTPIVSDLILIATYKQKPVSVYQVQFYANGQLIDTQIVEANKTAKEPNVVSLEGKKFSGWDKDVTIAITEDTVFTAQFETITFSVKFVDYNQTLLNEQTINYGESAIAPQDPTREGYEFIGWDKEFTSVLEDLTITAQYSVLSFVATYYDGDEVLGAITTEFGKAFAVPETPSKDGYSFDGWYSDSDLTIKYDFTQTATKDISLYAKFDEIVLETFTVKFFVDGTVISEQEIYSGKDAVAPGVPTKIGHTFSSWDVNFTNVTKDINVSAIFTKNSYTVKFYEKDRVSLIESVSVQYGESAVAPNAPTVAGHYFTSWSEDVTYVTEDIEVYAIYETQVVAVNFKEIDGTIIYSSSVKYGGNASIPATPSKMGQIFNGWYVDAECTEAFDFNTVITEETTLYAGWEQLFDAYTVHFYVDGNLYGSVQKVANGKYAIEPALPDGYTVWKLEGTDEIFDFENTPVTENIVLYAVSE